MDLLFDLIKISMWKQHYLSQMYLRWFSSDEKNTFCYSRDDKVLYSSLSNNDGSIKIKDCGCKEGDFWNTEIEEKIMLIETDLGKEMKNFRKTNDINKLSHEKLMKFIMMQLIRSQIAWNTAYDFIKKEIVQCRKMVKEKFWEDIWESDIRSIILDSFISRICNNSDIGWLWSFRNRKIYLSRISWERQFITTNFPFIHSDRDLYFPLTSKWIAFITIEENPIIELDTSIDFNNFRVELFNRQFANSHTDNRYIFWRKEEIEKLIFG